MVLEWHRLIQTKLLKQRIKWTIHAQTLLSPLHERVF